MPERARIRRQHAHDVGQPGETIRWYLFNLDGGGVWHNFHPHSARWQIPTPPGGATDVHAVSPVETFVMETEVRLRSGYRANSSICNVAPRRTPAWSPSAPTSCSTATSRST